MSKLQLIGDLFINNDNYDNVIKLFEDIDNKDRDSILLLTGNIGIVDRNNNNAFYRLLQHISNRFTLIFLVAGVYEYSGGLTFEETNQQISQWCTLNDSLEGRIHFLNNSEFKLSEKWIIFGTTLWPFIPPMFDIPPNFKFDYESIKGESSRSCCSMRDQNNWNKNDIKQLKSTLQSYSFTSENIIILSHFPPTDSVFNDSIPKCKKLISWCKIELESLVDMNSNLKYWCYSSGSTGCNEIKTIEQLSLLTNQVKDINSIDSKQLLSVELDALILDYQVKTQKDIPTTTTTTTISNIKSLDKQYQEQEKQNKDLLESILSVLKNDDSVGSTNKLMDTISNQSEEHTDNQKKRKFFINKSETNRENTRKDETKENENIVYDENDELESYLSKQNQKISTDTVKANHQTKTNKTKKFRF